MAYVETTKGDIRVGDTRLLDEHAHIAAASRYIARDGHIKPHIATAMIYHAHPIHNAACLSERRAILSSSYSRPTTWKNASHYSYM